MNIKNYKHIIISGGRQCGKTHLMKELDILNRCCELVELPNGHKNSYWIKCPYCGHEDTEFDENTEDSKIIECSNCGKKYQISWCYEG